MGQPMSIFPHFRKRFDEGLMEGKLVAITGTTSGTGFVCAKVMAELGAKVLLLNRPSKRVAESLANLKDDVPDGKFVSIECDLQSFSSVRRAAEAVQAEAQTAGGLDVLCNTAGIMMVPMKETE